MMSMSHPMDESRRLLGLFGRLPATKRFMAVVGACETARSKME